MGLVHRNKLVLSIQNYTFVVTHEMYHMLVACYMLVYGNDILIYTYEINQIHVTFYLVSTYKCLQDMWITSQICRFAYYWCYYMTFVPFVQLQFTRLVPLCYLSIKTSLSHFIVSVQIAFLLISVGIAIWFFCKEWRYN